MNRRRVLAVCAAMTALAAAGCGHEAQTTSSGPIKTDTYSTAPATVPMPRPQKPAEVTHDVKALWRTPRATALDRTDGTTPRMRAARRLIGSYVSDKVVPDKRAVEALLGKPDRGKTSTTWRYLLSIRRPPNDTCERDLEVEFRRDGNLNGLTMDGDEHCLSD